MRTGLEYSELIGPIFADFNYTMVPAKDESISLLTNKLEQLGVNTSAIADLREFYRISDGIPCLEIDFYRCGDEMMFEFWTIEKSLWLAQKDFNMLRWKDGKFHQGSASTLHFSDKHVFSDLYDALNMMLNEFKT